MRKALAILIVLVLLCTSGIIAAHAVVNTQRDKVVISENVIYGDKLAADGLNIIRKAQWEERLHWETDYTISTENTYSTEFHFTQDREYERSVSTLRGSISFGGYVGVGMGSSHEITREDVSRLAYGYEEICLDVMEAAPAGEEYTELVRVADYLDVYPLQVYIDFPNMYYLHEDERGNHYARPMDGDDCTEVNNAMREYFKFPVGSRDVVQVEVYKNENGIVTELDINTISYTPDYYIYSAVTPNGAYFAFDCGDDIDFSNVKGGCGIYCLPFGASFEWDGSTYPTANVDGLGMVYPLDKYTQIENMFYDEELDKLVLVTVEDGTFVFVVIDPNTMETFERIELAECEKDGGVWSVSREDGFIFIYLSDKRVAVIEILEDGNYELEFVTRLVPEEDDELFWYNSNSVKAYDGERLALCWDREVDEYPYYDCGFCVAVYDETGLLYFGEYESGLMTGRASNDYGYYCNVAGIRLNWK